MWDLSGKQLAVFRGDQHFVERASFSPDGQRIVTTSSDNTVRLWNLRGRQLAVLKGHKESVYNASFSPDGQLIVTTSFNNSTARLWDASGKPPVEIQVYQSRFPESWLDFDERRVDSASFSPDGQRILTVSGTGTVRLWDLSGRQLANLEGLQSHVEDASFSPDGQHIVTASWGGTARLWDLSGKQLAVLKGHQNDVESARFSPDAQRLLTESSDGTVRLWDLSGRQLAIFKEQRAEITSASFSSDGQHIVIASSEGTIRLWRVESLDQLLSRGCNWLKDYLASHPEELPKLEVCQNQSSSKTKFP
jgi:WD40 repeat protein